jgi:hypothetical protein
MSAIGISNSNLLPPYNSKRILEMCGNSVPIRRAHRVMELS